MGHSSDYACCQICGFEIDQFGKAIGNQEDGWELTLFICKDEDHYVCGKCIGEKVRCLTDEMCFDLEDGIIPSTYCPICRCKNPTNEMLVQFLLNKIGVTKDEIILEMQAQHK